MTRSETILHYTKRALRYLLIAVAVFYLLVVLGLVYLRFLPPLTTMVHMQRRVEAVLGGDEYVKRYEWVRTERISDHLEHAVVAAEDTRFYQHSGFDWEEIRKAREAAQREGRAPRGASTITQQLVKNLFLTTHRNYIRKGVELTLTPLAEVILGKDRILELYLNVIEWGIGVYGAEAAAHYYYGIPASELSRAQAARLAAVVPAPRTRSPDRMGWYSEIILRRMRNMGW